eukprot:3085120-Alexandrium_andersonii.AAC.1
MRPPGLLNPGSAPDGSLPSPVRDSYTSRAAPDAAVSAPGHHPLAVGRKGPGDLRGLQSQSLRKAWVRG